MLDENHQPHRKEDLQSYLANHEILKFDYANHEENLSDEEGHRNDKKGPSLPSLVLDVSISKERPKVVQEFFLVPYCYISVKDGSKNYG